MAKTFYFVKTTDGRYLQVQADMSTGQYRFWVNGEGDTRKAWTPCCDTVESAEAYRDAATAKVGELVIVQEAM